MTEREFKQRTKQFALQVIRLVEQLPKGVTSAVLGKQLLRCATSVGANYRAACRAKSTSDMLAKLAIVEEESDEAVYWLELLIEAQLVSKEVAEPLVNEANQICSMIVASMKTLRNNTR